MRSPTRAWQIDGESTGDCPLCGRVAYAWRCDSMPDTAYVDACSEHAQDAVDDLLADLDAGVIS